jgi:hypothetical protein
VKPIRRALARIFGRRTVVSGPHRIYVRRTPTGVVLDVEHTVTALVLDLVDHHLDVLLEIAEERAAARPYDGHRPESLLVEQLVTELGFELPVYGREVDALADRLLALAPQQRVQVTTQREGRDAA